MPSTDSPDSPATPQPGPRRMPTTLVRAAVRPRMLVLLVVLLAAAAVCARLGVWQLDRAQLRGQQVAAQQVIAQEDAPAVPIADLLEPQASFRAELVGRQVEASGSYEPAGQLLVSGRALDGRTGYLVLTPLRVGPSSAAGDPVLPVVRGWVADPADAGRLLAPPAGVVIVTGYLQVSEGPGSGASAAGQTDAISSAELVNTWAGPIYSGYLVLVTSDPDQPGSLDLLGPPTLGAGGDWNLQNLAYAAQWWIFGGFAVFLWARLVRDEAAGDRLEDPLPA